MTRSAVGLWRRGQDLPPNDGKKDEFERRMALYQLGLSDSEIGKALGRPTKTIWGWRNRKGLPANYPKNQKKKKEDRNL